MPDANGKAQLPPIAPGTYYLFGSAMQNGRSIIWNLKVVLKAGANTVTLDQGNAVATPR